VSCRCNVLRRSLYAAVADLKSQAQDIINLVSSFGFSTSKDGFIYNSADGFTAAVVHDQRGNYTIVYRGTDVGDAGLADLFNATTGRADPQRVDNFDVMQDISIAQGELTHNSQANDAVNLANVVVKLAGDVSKVHVVGQSLGGGLAELAAAATGASATLIAPAPFRDQLSVIAIEAALAANNITGLSSGRCTCAPSDWFLFNIGLSVFLVATRSKAQRLMEGIMSPFIKREFAQKSRGRSVI
jgi:hypothetical protein